MSAKDNLKNFKPYISPKKKVKEFSLKATILGIFLGFIFAIGNAYLGLKTGTTISASIPAAILSMAILKLICKKVTILENNITQTIATVGEGMAAGVIFTIPALFFLGENTSILKITILSALGGLLGILFMIPMRRYIIVEEHGVLPFPEGTACAEILKAGEKGQTSAAMAGWSFLVGVAYKLCINVFFLWQEIPTWVIKPFEKTQFSIDATPALLGVGYIIGPRIAGMMLAGSAISWWLIIPLIHMFGTGHTNIFPSTVPITEMSALDIWTNYVRYIGAGAVATGGFISLIKIGPLLFKTVHVGLKELFRGFRIPANLDRTDKDISLAWLIIGTIIIVGTLTFLPIAKLNIFTIILLVVLGFFFVAVTSITVGLVGSSSNPTSGMTLTVLLITCLLFTALGWKDRGYLIAAITMSAVANVAIAMAGTTSQDLKTGFLVGATPRSQQLAEIIGLIIPAAVLGITIAVLNKAYTLGSAAMPAPQAVLISMIAKGVISGDLPFTLVGIGVVLGIIVALLRVPVLPFAMGVYLPLSLNTAIMFGSLIAAYVNRHTRKEEAQEQGLLISSGLIGGDAFTGVIIALLTITGAIAVDKPSVFPQYISVIMFAVLALFVLTFTLKRQKKLK